MSKLHSFTKIERRQIRNKLGCAQNWLCGYCGMPMDRTSRDHYATIEHVKPLREGGTNDESNLMAVGYRCNISAEQNGHQIPFRPLFSKDTQQ